MSNRVSPVVPFRLFASVLHIVASAIILMNKDWNVDGCLLGDQSAKSLKDTELTIALSIMIGLCSIEIFSLISGVTIYSELQNFLSVGFHSAAFISLFYFLFNKTCSDMVWPIFATCTCLPFTLEVLTFIRVLVCKRMAIW